MRWLLLLYVFNAGQLNVVEFDRRETCEVAAKLLNKEFNGEPDENGDVGSNALVRCVER